MHTYVLTDTDRHTHRQRHIQIDTGTHEDTQTDTDRHRHTDTDRHKHADTDTRTHNTRECESLTSFLHNTYRV